MEIFLFFCKIKFKYCPYWQRDKLLFSIVSPHLEIVILSEGDARVEGSRDKRKSFYDHGLERQKEILRRGQRPCSG